MATKIQVAIEKEEHRTSKHSENHTQDNHASSPSSHGRKDSFAILYSLKGASVLCLLPGIGVYCQTMASTGSKQNSSFVVMCVESLMAIKDRKHPATTIESRRPISQAISFRVPLLPFLCSAIKPT